MNSFFRLVRELRAVWAMSSPRLSTSYAGALLQRLPAVGRAKSLAPVDAAMLGVQRLTCNGRTLLLPLGEIAELLRGRDDTPTFGMAREMYGANVYLRAFRPDLQMGTVIDLGANRGMFQLLAACGYRARIAIGIEPNPLYEPVLRVLRESNGIGADRVPRHLALAAGRCGEGRITLGELMGIHGLEEVDFLKCDIEGGEFDVILGDERAFDRVRNLAMELHHDAGDAKELGAVLSSRGFHVVTTDQFGALAPARAACYLYASKTNDLVH